MNPKDAKAPSIIIDSILFLLFFISFIILTIFKRYEREQN